MNETQFIDAQIAEAAKFYMQVKYQRPEDLPRVEEFMAEYGKALIEARKSINYS